MAPAFSYQPLAEANLKGALLVVAFPSAGFVSHVAARHLVRSQDLPLVGAFRSPQMPPAVAVEQGKPMPTLRVYAGDRACGLDRNCDVLATLIADVVPPDELRTPLATTIIDWAARNGVGCIISLESMPISDDGGREPRILCATHSDELRERLAKEGVDALDSVLVSGMSAALLDEERKSSPQIAAIFAEAHQAFRDAAAAAKLVEVIDKMLLHIPIDAAPLRKQAEQFTRELKDVAQRTQTAFPHLSMYG